MQAKISGKAGENRGQDTQVLVGKASDGEELHQRIEQRRREAIDVRLMNEIAQGPRGHPHREELVVVEALRRPRRERRGQENQRRECVEPARAQTRQTRYFAAGGFSGLRVTRRW